MLRFFALKYSLAFGLVGDAIGRSYARLLILFFANSTKFTEGSMMGG